MKKMLWSKVLPIMSALMALLIVLMSVPLISASAAGYTVEANPDDGFMVVTNPNGGARLSYSPSSGVKLLQVVEGGNTYAFKDLNQNGELDVYEDWRLDAEVRAQDLASKMSVEEIAGLMLFSPHQGGTAINENLSDTQKTFLSGGVRAVLNAGSGVDAETTAKWANAMQTYVEGLDWGIPVNFSSDPRHSSSSGEAYDGGSGTISKWPGNLGMAATFDPDLVEEFGQIASIEYRALGITTALSPQIDLATEPRWSRVSGTYGEDSLLATDMSRAYVDGFQSTFVDDTDIGWGDDSVNAMIKHWPGDGTGEAGRESHSNVGKYAVYPGDNLAEHLLPFTEGGLKLNGKTEAASAVMPSYSIGVNADGSYVGDDPYGSGYSDYKLVDLLRGEYGFEGVICSDWGITGMTAWGVGGYTTVGRHYLGIMNGLDMFGGNSNPDPIIEAYDIGVRMYGAEKMDTQFENVAYRVLLNLFRINTFEDPYLDVQESVDIVGNAEYMQTGYEAQLESIVMLKNEGNVISNQTSSTDKPTVYIPMQFIPAREAVYSPIDGSLLSPATRASWRSGLDENSASRYFNVVTDTLNDDADPSDAKETDYTRRTDFTGVDFALLAVSSPVSPGSMFAGYGYVSGLRNLNPEAGEIDNGYRPISLQYREYTADPEIVREYPLGVDEAEEKAWIAAGGEAGKSRYYGGKSSTVTNESDLDLILDTAAQVDVPVIVAVRASRAMCFYEFEEEVDGIVMGFGVSDQAILEVIAGKYEPNGLLPMQMPANMETVEAQLEDVAKDMDCHVDTEGSVYDFGFGLNWSGQIDDDRVAKYVDGEDPEPTDPEPTDPEPTDPEPTDPEPTDPEPTDPDPVGEIITVENPNDGATLTYYSTSGVEIIYDGEYAFKDLDKDGELDVYEDWREDAETRARDLASKMSVEEIAGLMLFSPHQGGTAISPNLSAAQKTFLDGGVRAVLNAGSGVDATTTAQWANAMQSYVESLDWGIPVNFSSDPRHSSSSGEAYSGGSGTISKWPGNLGMAATFNPDLLEEFGQIASVEYRALGITTALSPQIDLATEPRWARVSGTYGEDSLLATDMTRAYVDGFQSTYVDGTDIGWGGDSVNAMVKHWPGDGTGEGGRESHSNVGKYAVYPGNNFAEHLLPFTEGGFKLNGKTGSASAVMPSYSIGVNADGSYVGDDPYGSGYSDYKLVDLLRGEYGFEGVICSDWGITGMTAWGVGDLTTVERHYLGIMNGLDMFGGNSDPAPIVAAYELGVAEVGQDVMDTQFENIAYRVLLNLFRIETFETPYLDVEESDAIVGNEEYMEAGYNAQLESIVMLKNEGNIISDKTSNADKPTVYIPMQFIPATEDVYSPIDGSLLSRGTPASWRSGLDAESASKYFNVVTDTLNDDADPEDAKETDYTRLTDFTGVDFALLAVSSPTSPGSMFSGYGYVSGLRNLDPEAGEIDNGYRPISLQYREYTADPELVREYPLGVDPAEEEAWIAAGGEAGKSRYYGGKSTTVNNESDLDLILDTAAQVDVPVIVAVRASRAMCFYEFEEEVDGIVMGFGVSDQAILEVIAGKYEPNGLLPMQMPANMETVETQLEDVAKDMECHVDAQGNTYDFGFGLNWSGQIDDDRVAKYVDGDTPIPEYLIGDANDDGEVSMADLLKIQRFIARIDSFDNVRFFVSDVDKNGKVNLKDVLRIQKWIAKMLPDEDYINTYQKMP